jgi:hypothetical protein
MLRLSLPRLPWPRRTARRVADDVVLKRHYAVTRSTHRPSWFVDLMTMAVPSCPDVQTFSKTLPSAGTRRRLLIANAFLTGTCDAFHETRFVSSSVNVRASALPLASAEPSEQAQQDSFAVATLCTPHPQNTRPAIVVRNGAELQNALDDAKAGDTIELEVGATFKSAVADSSVVLRNRSIPEGE